MKIYIATDMEGMAGIVNGWSTMPKNPDYDRYRKLMTGEVNAAIATALYMYFNELHDDESNIITIKKVSKFYSPWSSKIYGLRNQLRS